MLFQISVALLFVLIVNTSFAQDSTKKVTIVAGNDNIRVSADNKTLEFSNGDMGNYYLAEGKKKGLKEDYQGAIDDFTLALLFDEKSAEAFYNRGLATYYLGNYESAIEDMTTAISIDSTQENYYSQRGICYSMLSQYTEAKSDFDKALLMNPNSANCNLNMGVLLLSTGNYSDACDYLYKAQGLGSEKAGKAIDEYCK